MGTGEKDGFASVWAFIQNGLIIKSGGARIITTIVLGMLVKRMTGGHVTLHDLGHHWKWGLSSGGISGTIYSLRDERGKPLYSDDIALAIIVPVIARMFNMSTAKFAANNISHEIAHFISRLRIASGTRLHTRELFKVIAGNVVMGEKITQWRASDVAAAAGISTLTYLYRGAHSLLHVFTANARKNASTAKMERVAQIHYDNAVLEEAMRISFGGHTPQTIGRPLFYSVFNQTTAKPELMGDPKGPAPVRRSGLQVVDAGQPYTGIPVYRNIPAYSSLMGSTAIEGALGHHVIPELGQAFMDMGDHTMSMLPLIVQEMSNRAEVALQQPDAPTPKQNFLSILRPGNPALESIKTVIVPRVLIIGTGTEEFEAPDPSEKLGVVRSGKLQVRAAEITSAYPALVNLHALHDPVSNQFTGSDSVVEIAAPAKPDPTDPERHRYPTYGIPGLSDGRVSNIEKLIWWGAHRLFKNNVPVLVREISVQIRALRDQGVQGWTPERVDAAEAAMKANTASPEKIEDMCNSVLRTEAHIQRMIDRYPTLLNVVGNKLKSWQAEAEKPIVRAVARLPSTKAHHG